MSIVFRALITLCLLLAAPRSAQAALTVFDLRAGVQGDATRIVVEATTPVNAQILDGQQATINLGPFTYKGETPQPHISTNIGDILINEQAGTIILRFNGPVRLVENFALDSLEHPRSKRLVFDFKVGAGVANRGRTTRMPVQQQATPSDRMPDPPQILGQVHTQRARPAPAQLPMPTRLEEARAVADAIDPTPPPETVLARDAQSAEPLRVVIDAGHGGKDPGALSPAGLREKDITLGTARALANELERRGHTVFLTRATDIFIPLRERVNIGRKHKADLFISVHADSMGNGNKATRGSSVYTLSDVASDKESAQLAARENQVDVLAGIDLSHEDKDVANILIDLAVRDTMNQSKKLANTLVAELKSEGLPTLSPAHRFAGFAVLKAPDVPSILIELGFLSNPNESQLLASQAHQTRLARTIANTVDIYAQRHRPRN